MSIFILLISIISFFYLSGVGQSYGEIMGEVVSEINSETKEGLSKIEGRVNNAKDAIFIIGVLFFIFVLSWIFTILKSILKPIRDLCEANEEVKKGNLNVGVDVPA